MLVMTIQEDILFQPSWRIITVFLAGIFAVSCAVQKPYPLHIVIAGGQTGVDQAALRAAQAAGLLTGGWCPPHRDIGDGRRVPDDFPLSETPRDASPDAPDVPRSQRTEWNVRDAQATLILRGPEQSPSDKGTDWTIRFARSYGKPFLICDPKDPKDVDRAV